MGSLIERYKASIAMVAMQFAYAAMSLLSRAALTQGMSPRVFVVYRQAVATIFLAPIAYFARRGKPPAADAALGIKNFSLIFLTSLIGITINQNCYFLGMYHTSSSIATAMGNLLPVITFVLAAVSGFEKVNLRSLRSIAKIIGTVACVLGAISIALFKGTRLLNMKALTLNSIGGNWVLGCSLVFASSTCWSIWLILQVPMSKSYPDHLYLSTWMCFLATIQSAIIAIISEPNLETWKFSSSIMILCCIYSGIMGSGVSFFVQSWCISIRGPLFSAMFNPLCTVIVTISACILLHEQLYLGSLIGVVVVVAGLYVVLWGKGQEVETKAEDKPSYDTSLIKGFSDKTTEIKEPLLGLNSYNFRRNETTP